MPRHTRSKEEGGWKRRSTKLPSLALPSVLTFHVPKKVHSVAEVAASYLFQVAGWGAGWIYRRSREQKDTYDVDYRNDFYQQRICIFESSYLTNARNIAKIGIALIWN